MLFVLQGQRPLTAGHATCHRCTGRRVMELRCCFCEQVKGLDGFAMNRREEHEFARCLVCVQGLRMPGPSSMRTSFWLRSSWRLRRAQSRTLPAPWQGLPVVLIVMPLAVVFRWLALLPTWPSQENV
ncbi:hypothetical protein BDW66DRAFT_14760 [Aspergillus desertorum]